jgi:hypothetical protein
VRQVLSNKYHPRYALYSGLNANLSTTNSNGESGLNLWMRLCTPYEWQDAEILQVTADLYDVFIVQYTMKSPDSTKFEEVKVRGNYNSTHWLIQFVSGNHFQPLIPADHILSEFTFPPITRQNTEGSNLVPKNTPKGGTDLNHPWRSPISRLDVPEQLFPRQALQEMSILDFALIAGFNRKDSSLCSIHLQAAYHRVSAETQEYASLADGTETIESKLMYQNEPSIGPAESGHAIQEEIIDLTIPVHANKKIKVGPSKPPALAKGPPEFAGPITGTTINPIRVPPAAPQTVPKVAEQSSPKVSFSNTLMDIQSLPKPSFYTQPTVADPAHGWDVAKGKTISHKPFNLNFKDLAAILTKRVYPKQRNIELRKRGNYQRRNILKRKASGL